MSELLFIIPGELFTKEIQRNASQQRSHVYRNVRKRLNAQALRFRPICWKAARTSIQYNTTSFISNIEHNNITPTICSQHWDGWKGGGQKNILIVTQCAYQGNSQCLLREFVKSRSSDDWRRIQTLSIMPRSVGVTGVFSSASCPTVPCPWLSTMPVAIPRPQSLFSVPEIWILCVHVTWAYWLLTRCLFSMLTGCGAHIERVLGDVPLDHRCKCKDKK